MLSIILFFLFLEYQNDFIIFYESSKIFFGDIENLYDQSKYLWDFRYFPLSALFFIPFSFLEFRLAFIIFNIMNYIINILVILVLYKIIILIKGKDHEEDNKRVILYLSLYLMGVPHILNYIHGQINLYITFFVLVSLIIFLTQDSYSSHFLGSLILGISIIIKPTTIFLIPFIILIQFDIKTKKLNFKCLKSLVRVIGVIIPVSLNLFLFLFFPKLWYGFLTTNFTGSNPSAFNFSFSLTKLITNFCFYFNLPYSQLWVLILTTGLVGGIGFIIFLFRKESKDSIIYGYALGIIIMFLSYFDTWDHHLLNLTPLLILIIFNLPRRSDRVNLFKRTLFFFNFFDIIFIGIWFLSYMILPYNFVPTIALFLCYYGISRIILGQFKNRSIKNGD